MHSLVIVPRSFHDSVIHLFGIWCRIWMQGTGAFSIVIGIPSVGICLGSCLHLLVTSTVRGPHEVLWWPFREVQMHSSSFQEVVRDLVEAGYRPNVVRADVTFPIEVGQFANDAH